MLRKEWPLIANTILAQLAAGMFLFLALARMSLTPLSPPAVQLLLRTGLIAVGPVMVLAMGLSLFHLGQPFRAYRAMANLPVSWLSWEIFLSSAFLLLWGACVWADRSGATGSYLLITTALVGFFNVVSMSNIYSSTGRPGWSETGTYLDFLGSMIIFGSVGTAFVLLRPGLASGAVTAWLNASIFAALLVLSIELVAALIFVSNQKETVVAFSLDKLASSSDLNELLLNKYLKIFIVGWFLSFAGAELIYLNINRYLILPVLLALLLALAGELIRRYGFFVLLGESEDASQYVSAISYAKHLDK